MTSNIDPNIPLPGTPVSAAAIQNNFKQAYDEITALQATGTGSVSVVTATNANGVIFDITTPTTTPNITIDLGNITPDSVAAVGTVTGSNLSGTNTGDQTITLSGNVSGIGMGGIVTTIDSLPASFDYQGSTVTNDGSVIDLGGLTISTGGGEIDTNSGDIDTDGGDIDTGGGDITLDGGTLNTNGGDARVGDLFVGTSLNLSTIFVSQDVIVNGIVSLDSPTSYLQAHQISTPSSNPNSVSIWVYAKNDNNLHIKNHAGVEKELATTLSALLLDQTVPQTVSSGRPIFDAGLDVGDIGLISWNGHNISSTASEINFNGFDVFTQGGDFLSGGGNINLDGGFINDFSDTAVLDPDSRTLIESDGTTISLDFENHLLKGDWTTDSINFSGTGSMPTIGIYSPDSNDVIYAAPFIHEFYIDGVIQAAIFGSASSTSYFNLTGGNAGEFASVSQQGDASGGLVLYSVGSLGVSIKTNNAASEGITINNSGVMSFDNTNSFVANGVVAVSLGSTGPAGVNPTPSKWLKVLDESGNPGVVPWFAI